MLNFDKQDRNFHPTTQWMAEKYQEINKELFNGKLGDCNFKIFTTGKGSQGGVLGWFCIEGKSLKFNRYDRHIYQYLWGEKRYVNRENFVEICEPCIKLNGNYTGTEYAFAATLTHEMCHYYTYMDGFIEKRSHGTEFQYIASIITQRSNNLFTVQKIATAEQMSGLDLSDEMKAKVEKRIATKKNNLKALFAFKTNGEIRLTTTADYGLIREIIYGTEKYHEKTTKKILLITDPSFISFLVDTGYRINMKRWRYWNVEKEPWIDKIEQCNYEVLYENPELNKETQGQTLTTKPKPQTPTKKIFSIKTNKGVFETEFDGNLEKLKRQLKERFPRMSDDAIELITSNKNNYKTMMEENKTYLNKIINEVIKEVKTKKKEIGSITPDMNLGLFSPEEYDNLT